MVEPVSLGRQGGAAVDRLVLQRTESTHFAHSLGAYFHIAEAREHHEANALDPRILERPEGLQPLEVGRVAPATLVVDGAFHQHRDALEAISAAVLRTFELMAKRRHGGV